MNVYQRLVLLGWREQRRGHSRRYFRKGDWLAEIPDRIDQDMRFTRTHYHGVYRGW